jgi:predicted component of type VI protein secretion system
VYTGDQRPLDLGDYVLVEATEVTQEVTSGKKRGDTTTTIDKDKETVTVTYTAVDQTDSEQWASIRAERDSKLIDSDWRGMSDVTMSSAWKTYRQALRDLPASESDPDDITWPTKPS